MPVLPRRSRELQRLDRIAAEALNIYVLQGQQIGDLSDDATHFVRWQTVKANQKDLWVKIVRHVVARFLADTYKEYRVASDNYYQMRADFAAAAKKAAEELGIDTQNEK